MNSALLADLETPTVLVDRDRLLANIARVQTIADRRGLRLRPHLKTHKCFQIAALQLERGAVGFTASKVDEAVALIDCGATSLTLAYPIADGRKLRRLLSAAREREVEIRTIADSAEGIEILAAIAAEFGNRLDVFLKIDVGLHRCGFAEDDPRLLAAAQSIAAASSLRFAGLLSHAGHAYGAKGRTEIAAIAAEECAILQRVRAILEAAAFEVAEVSVGSTPTVLASESYEGVTEIRPGNYVFFDATAIRLGIATLDEIALTVLATIVSRNDKYFIIDAGSKVLSSDVGAHGTGSGLGYGLAFTLDGGEDPNAALHIARLSEEHGFVERGDADLAIGTKVRIVPNHSCPVANLTDQLAIVSRGAVLERWPVAARSRVR
ncbi:MAG: alanine racemase [Verrucomicrobiota bacterium]|nr:alanine racemase [Verrucomicrobiota bacterium]